MKIKKVVLNRFKRFTDLTVQGIPETARLVILAGPNGCGKSSLFDALNVWYRYHFVQMGNWQMPYHAKQTGERKVEWSQAVRVEFFDPQPANEEEKRKALYVRSAYRNDPELRVRQLTRVESALLENRIERLIDNDATVAKNYERLASRGLEDLYEFRDGTTTFEQYRQESIGELRNATEALFPGLVLSSLGNPLTSGTFKFSKGTSKDFVYMNLSGGEKAAFDLILDVVVKKREFNNTVFCIDEPEAHMNTRLQGALLEQLFRLVPANSQLWLATHSIGMMRRARDLWSANAPEVVFLDLEDKDFDQTQILEPIVPTRVFWHRVLHVALDDLSELVAPSKVVICEGKPLGTGGKHIAVDAKCYDEIFADEFPETRFLSGGNASDVETDRIALVEAIKALVGGANVVRLLDRDDMSDAEVAVRKQNGTKVLTRRHIESYLFDDEVLTALCNQHNKSGEIQNLLIDKTAALAALPGKGKPKDDLKSAAPDIYLAAKRRLQLTQCGNTTKSFMEVTLAPLVQKGMKVYEELKQDIFGP